MANSIYRQMLSDAASQFLSGRVMDAKKIIEQALLLEPNDWSGWAILGGYNWQSKAYEKATEQLRTARSLAVDRKSQVSCEFLLADCMLETGALDEAERLLKRLWFEDDYSAAGARLVNLLRRKGQQQKAGEVLNDALRRFPSDGDLLGEKAYSALARAEFAGAWEAYRIHHYKQHGGHINTGLSPYWNGENLSNKRCLVWINQGLGDQLIFSRYLSCLEPVAKGIVVVCDARLISLFEVIHPAVVFLSESDDAATRSALLADNFDFQMFGSDLPVAFNSEVGEKSVFRVLDVGFETSVMPGQIKKIGICWRSGFREEPTSIDRWTLDHNALQSLGSIKNVVLGDLQHGKTHQLTDMEAEFKRSLYRQPGKGPNDEVRGFMQFICEHDLIVATDTSAAIFSAMLGKSTWVLTPEDPFWFLSANQTQRWFPNVRLFRKPWHEGWGNYVDREIIPKIEDFLATH